MEPLRKKRRGDATVAQSEVNALHGPFGKYDAFFQYILGMDEASFFSKYFERKAYHFRRNSKDSASFFQTTVPPLCCLPLDWSSEKMEKLCSEKNLQFTTDINIVKYQQEEKRRIPYQTKGQVTSQILMDCFKERWSVRFLRPHEHSTSVAQLVRAMEEVFQCSSGANSYWTPKGSQGFAPHYDDVDVFLFQLEGSKRWRLHKAPQPSDQLSRHSSEDYTPDEIGDPIMTTVLHAGDVLYMPRGTIHQGDTFATSPQEDSLHVTFSAFQMHSMADLVLRMTQFQIETLAANNIEWRRGIPRSWSSTLGSAFGRGFAEEFGCCALSHSQAGMRSANLSRLRDLFKELSDALHTANAIDNGVDRYAIDVLSKCQAPTVLADPADAAQQGAQIWDMSSEVRLCTAECVRLVMYVPGEAQVFHTGSNSRICLETPLGQVRFEREFAAAIGVLIGAYPNTCRVSELPMPFDDAEDVVENRRLLVNTLLTAGVLKIAP